MMTAYQQELEKMEDMRSELVKAEKLFELPITLYPELLHISKNMAGLTQLYDIYVLQKVVISYLLLNCLNPVTRASAPFIISGVKCQGKIVLRMANRTSD